MTRVPTMEGLRGHNPDKAGADARGWERHPLNNMSQRQNDTRSLFYVNLHCTGTMAPIAEDFATGT